MSLGAQMVNGELVYSSTKTTETGSTQEAKKGNASALDKDAFLQLLVAEMKYQDPMEPTSNTEYIAQFTTFSELEQIQNMSSSMDLQRASNLVGQYVLINHESETTGDIKQIMGKVDYVFYENNKAYLHVDGGDYSLDELDTVIDAGYYAANGLATEFMNAYSKLPPVADLTTGYEDAIKALSNLYESMTDYQKGFLSSDYTSGLKAYEEKIAELKATEEPVAEEPEAEE